MTGIQQWSWRLAAFLLVYPAISSCGGDDSGQDPVTKEDVASFITDNASTWLDGFQDRADVPFICPNRHQGSAITPSDNSVRACPRLDNDGNYFVRVQNLSDVPMSVWGDAQTPVFTVQPGLYLDMRTIGAEFGQVFYYRRNAMAGLSAVVVSEVQNTVVTRKVGGLSWVGCAADPDKTCVTRSLFELLPKRVKIGRFNVPVKVFAEGLGLAYEQRDLIDTFADDFGSRTPGTLRIDQPAPAL